MYFCASFWSILVACDRPKAETPYRIAKFALLAIVRCSEVTVSGATLNTSEAVRRWMSSPRRNDSMMAGSADMWARMRSSICE